MLLAMRVGHRGGTRYRSRSLRDHRGPFAKARRWAAVFPLAATLLGLTAARAAAAPSPLVFSAADYSTLGLHPTRASAGAARTELAAGLPTRVSSPIKHASIEASGASSRRQELRFDAFVLRSASAASHLLTSWRRAHRAGRVRIAAGGAIWVRSSRRRATAEVLWRDGARLGLIVLTVTRRTSTARRTAFAYAVLAQPHLATRLPTTAWGKVLDEVRANGSVSEATALQAFALAYGPLPGIHPPGGAHSTVPSATLAGLWTLRYLPRLSQRLRRAIDRDLGFAPASTARARAHTASFGDPGFQQSASITTAANQWAAVYADGGHLAHPLHLQIVAGTTTSALGDMALADAYPVNAAGAESDSGPYCRIRVAPAVAHGPIATLVLTLAHEVFHCFEFELDASWGSQPAWLIEGMAEWAALTVDPVTNPTDQAWLIEYIDTPANQLFARTYDASGFWGHAQDSTGSLWPRIATILNAPGNEAQFAAAGGNTEAFLSTWGSSVFRLASGGLPWEMQSPVPPLSSYGDPPITDLDAAAGATVEAAPYTTAQYAVNASSADPLLHVTISGHARLSRQYNYTDLGSAWFCTSGSCACPPDTTGTTPPSQPLGALSPLGLSGDPGSGTHGSLAAVPLSDFCKPMQQQPSNNGNAGSGGDPHLIDFDGRLFDFQAAGEFTLLKSTRDKLEIQERQQPFPHSRSVSVNTAVAMRVGGAVVEIDSASRNGVSAFVNHHRVRAKHVALAGGGSLAVVHTGLSLPAGANPASLCKTALPAGGLRNLCVQLIDAFVRGSTTATVRWRDGTTVQISNSLTSPNAVKWAPALSLQIKVAHGRLRHLTGLLGNAGVSATREFLGRDRKRYNAADIVNGAFGTALQARILYHEFGASWRISKRQSLFTYKRHKSTRSYTIANFPSQAFDLSRAPAAKTQRAGAICQAAGITNHAVMKDCEYDVVATGNDAFAGGDVPLQKVAATYGTTTKPPPLHPIDLGTGGNPPKVAYDPAARETYVVWLDNSDTSIDVCAVSAAAPACNGGAGPYHLVDPLANSGGANPLYFYPQVVVEPGGEVVVMAEADGASSSAQPPGYQGLGVVAWSSPAGGAAFGSASQGIADGGILLASTPGTGDAPSGGAIALDGSSIGVYGDQRPFGSGFTDFMLGTPAPSTTPTVDGTGQFGDQLQVDSSQLASIPDPSAPGQYIVVAVGADYGAPTGCPAGTMQATGYGVGVGTPAALQTQAAWNAHHFAPLSCQAFSPVLSGGGPSGGTIGLLQDEGPGLAGHGKDGVYYRRFNAVTATFGPPVLVSDETNTALLGADALSVSQDASGGVYASWLDHRGWVLNYSSTGGASWGTARATGLTSGTDAIAVGLSGGGAELAYTANPGSGTHEYLVPLAYSLLAP
jgi:hypothetical protein